MKRIVLTSSVRAVVQAEAGRTYTEEDWADDAVEEVKEKGSAASGMSMYGAGKVLAERGASPGPHRPHAQYQPTCASS